MLAPLDPLPTVVVAASLPRLAPRPPTAATVSSRNSELKPSPTRRQWDSHRAELAKLYLRERRSLRTIMQHMEMVHGLKATAQIYKHNFARWGFQKNKKHLLPADQCVAVTQAATSGREQPSQTQRDSPLSTSLTLSHHDNLILALILHVRTWNSSFYEHHKSCTPDNEDLSPPPASEWLNAQNARNLVITFDLVSDSLKRGHGDLAGRMARKAFLLAESILETDPPALLWNLLGVMHRMLTRGHLRLLWMLLTHMTGLVQGRYARSHPLSITLRHLRDSARSSMNESSCLAVSSSDETSPSSQDSPGATSECHVLAIVEKVWLLNTEMLFDHLDIGLREVYEHIKIDLCPIPPPAVSPDVVTRWATQLKESRPLEYGLDAASPFEDTPFPVDTLETVLLPPAVAQDAIPGQYNLVQRQIGTILRHVEDEILEGTSRFIGHAKLAIVVVAGLMMGQRLRELQSLIADLGEGSAASNEEYKQHALKTACIIRMILDSQASLAEVGCYIGWDTIAMNKCIVALYDYADANLDPQALQELSVLEDALIEANEMDSARQVGMNRLQRLRQYVAEIPVGSA